MPLDDKNVRVGVNLSVDPWWLELQLRGSFYFLDRLSLHNRTHVARDAIVRNVQIYIRKLAAALKANSPDLRVSAKRVIELSRLHFPNSVYDNTVFDDDNLYYEREASFKSINHRPIIVYPPQPKNDDGTYISRKVGNRCNLAFLTMMRIISRAAFDFGTTTTETDAASLLTETAVIRAVIGTVITNSTLIDFIYRWRRRDSIGYNDEERDVFKELLANATESMRMLVKIRDTLDEGIAGPGSNSARIRALGSRLPYLALDAVGIILTHRRPIVVKSANANAMPEIAKEWKKGFSRETETAIKATARATPSSPHPVSSMRSPRRLGASSARAQDCQVRN